VNNDHASASILLQGAHLMTWAPKGEKPVIWMSREAKFVPGKSVRGGVPVCWPWFGPHATDAKLPAHGFARTVPWEVTDTKALDDGVTALTLTLVADEKTRAMWPHAVELSIRIEVGDALQMALTTTNLSDHEVVIGEALHTYFQIGDIAATRVRGLAGCEYIDKVAGGARQRQDGPITFSGETDRMYVNTESSCMIEDERLRRRIVVDTVGSRSTVVWNPWADKAEKMGDFGPQGWRRMLCVESANAADNVVAVAAGDSHTLKVRYRVEPW
jgi:glucose-6-phosphate 1-epimerase